MFACEGENTVMFPQQIMNLTRRLTPDTKFRAIVVLYKRLAIGVIRVGKADIKK